MRPRYLNAIFAVLTVMLMIVCGSGSISAQGRGHGGGGGGGGQPQRQAVPAPQRQTAPAPQVRQQGPPQRAQAPQIRQAPPQMRQMPQMRVQQMPQQRMPQMRMEQPRIQQQRIQPQRPTYAGPPVRMQQPRIQQPRMPQIERQNPGRARIEQPRIQPQIERRPDITRTDRQPNRTWMPDVRAGGQKGNRIEGQPGRTWTPDIRGAGQRGNRIDRGQNNDVGVLRQGNDRGAFRQEQQIDNSAQLSGARTQGPPAWSHAWPNNYGYQRSTEVHARNDLRRAERTLQSDNRVANWFASRYADLPQYRQDPQTFVDQELWRTNLLRDVVVSAAVSNPAYYGSYYPNYYTDYNPYYSAYSPVYYDPYYGSYAPAYYDPAYFGIPYDPAYYGSLYYDGYPGYSGYPTVPYYYGGPTFSISFSFGDGGYPYYSNAYDPYYTGYSDVYYDDFPYAVFTDPYYSDSYTRRAYSELVAYGYDQGYLDGLAARRAGYGTDYFSDPYVYDNNAYTVVTYSPYSYSLGENRRCLSKGYELGYMDALYGGRDYVPYQYGDVDMVSAFVSNVSLVL